MNEFTKNITIITRYRNGKSNTYFVYKNLSDYLNELDNGIVVQLNKDGSYEYETTWSSYLLTNYEHKNNLDLNLGRDVIEEFTEKYAIWFARELLKEINCDYVLHDYTKTPKQ